MGAGKKVSWGGRDRNASGRSPAVCSAGASPACRSDQKNEAGETPALDSGPRFPHDRQGTFEIELPESQRHGLVVLADGGTQQGGVLLEEG